MKLFSRFLTNRKTKSSKKNRMLVLHKKQITALSLMILIGIAGYLNWSFQQNAVDPEVAVVYNQVTKKIGEAQMVNGDIMEDADSTSPTNSTSVPTTVNDYFTQARLERDIKRSEAMDMISEILNAQSTDKEARTKAEDEIHRLADFTEKETMTENIIRAKGFAEAVVFMGENLVSIAVKSQGLNEIDAAVIRDAAMGTTNYAAEQIKIVEIK